MRTYHWYFGKLGACGAMDEEMKEQEDKFINPEKYEKLKAIEDEEVRKRKEMLLNEEEAKMEMLAAF